MYIILLRNNYFELKCIKLTSFCIFQPFSTCIGVRLGALSVSFQRVLKDLISDKLPKLSSHLLSYSMDLTLFTFNWFMTVFIDNIPIETCLRIWDAFLLEGSKV